MLHPHPSVPSSCRRFGLEILDFHVRRGINGHPRLLRFRVHGFCDLMSRAPLFAKFAIAWDLLGLDAIVSAHKRSQATCEKRPVMLHTNPPSDANQVNFSVLHRLLVIVPRRDLLEDIDPIEEVLIDH